MIDGLHKRDTMTAYVIFDVPPGGDQEAMKPYREKAFDTLTRFGGNPGSRSALSARRSLIRHGDQKALLLGRRLVDLHLLHDAVERADVARQIVHAKDVD